MTFQEFKECVDALTPEYEAYYRSNIGHSLTCEFSTTSEDFEEKVDYLARTSVFGGRWEIYRCTYCESYKEGHKWHVQIDESHDMDFLVSSAAKFKRDAEEANKVSQEIIQANQRKEFYPAGTLMALVREFESAVETPERFDGYVAATASADMSRQLLMTWVDNPKYKELEKKLMGDDQHD